MGFGMMTWFIANFDTVHDYILGQGHTKETGNRNYQELLSAWVEHKEPNGAAQIEEMAMQLGGRLRNSTSRQRNKPVFSQLCSGVVS
jgi:hypothetical protein